MTVSISMSAHPAPVESLKITLQVDTGKGLADLDQEQDGLREIITSRGSGVGTSNITTVVQRLGDPFVVEQVDRLSAPGNDLDGSATTTRINLQYHATNWRAKVAVNGDTLGQEDAVSTVANVLAITREEG